MADRATATVADSALGEEGDPSVDPSPDPAVPAIEERLRNWADLEALAVREPDPAGGTGLRFALEDAAGPEIGVDVPADDGPVHFRHRFDLPGAADLPRARVAEVVEHVVLQRSAMIDARVVDGPAAEMVVAVYPDGLTRHSFMTSLFECQKVEEAVRRDVRAALLADTTVATLRTLADATWGPSDP